MTSIHPAIFSFLKSINEHNTREFFALVRPLYDEIWENLNDRTAECMSELHRQLGVKFGDVKTRDCLFRVYRDARRIKEGDLIYKKNFGMVLGPNGKNDHRANGFYLHLQSEASFFGGGLYWPEPADLARVRKFMSLHGDKFYKITEDPKFIKNFGKVQGEESSKLPRGFDDKTNFPELVKKKQFVIYKKYTDKQILAEDFMSKYISDCKLAKPFFDLLNEACEFDEE